ncbi:TPA: hypothetical protein N0F65_004646 [Lagenidium giganteum]|uniref:1-phosphatidylinositol-3-phosphate 5-kinase n=1 Tax=Lagenidium giganteum TaxID=4803 RepID=A0AAV2ZBE4_9STRA|nr:TPA: hypothetical protein N0F65_004646 [Lagenidium giganteum]
MAMLCEVVKNLALSCTSAHDDAADALRPGARQRAASEVPLGDATRFLTRHPQGLFTRSVERVLTLHASSTGLRRSGTIEACFGMQLAASSRRDFRACVDFVISGSEADALGLLPGAVVIAINGQSAEGWSMEQVEKEIRQALQGARLHRTRTHGRVSDVAASVTLELSQRVEEMNVDTNPYHMTMFPSPQGNHLPGVKQFFESEEDTVSSQSLEMPPAQRRRDRSRSMKHFWMSDRSAKACHECDQLFTFFRRRHHCRSCGQIFCSQCCARLPQSFGGTKEDEFITRLRKQLVCHTCHRQLREGLEVELTRAGFQTDGQLKGEPSPSSQTLLLMPPQITEALERSTSDASNIRQLDKGELFDKDEITDDTRGAEQAERARPPALFSMFPKVQIVASVQQLTHPPRLQTIAKEVVGVGERRVRTLSDPLIVCGAKETRKDEMFRSFTKLKRCNSRGDIGNPSCHRWSESEFKRFVDESHERTLVASSLSSKFLWTRPKALSATFGEARFGIAAQKNPFHCQSENENSSKAKVSAAECERLLAKEIGILGMVGLAEGARDESSDADAVLQRERASQQMFDHARTRIEEKIFHLLDKSSYISQLQILEQHKWMQIINLFALRAAATIMCSPDRGDSMDVMEYVRIKSVQGGRVQDSFYIDGVLVHKSLARKGMRSDIENPRILLIASELDYHRKKEAISSLESVAVQEVEYMHIVAEKIMTLHPDVVLFGGHVHRVAEELLFKENVAVVKNVRLVDLQRIARCTGASLLTSYDHVDKITEKGVIGTCKRFYVMISDQEPRSVRRLTITKLPNGGYGVDDSMDPMGSRKKRPQRQNIVFDGGITSKGCTICLRGGAPEVFEEVTEALSTITRAAYNMRLQRSVLTSFGFLPPPHEDQENRSVAEEWFAKTSTSLYISLKSNSLSLRAALKESQTMCKRCKDNTRYNNISSLRVLGGTNRSNEFMPRRATESSFQVNSAPSSCTCSNRFSGGLRDRILFSACWSTLEGKTASKAEMMCIDFYSSNDCSLGQFLNKYCFSTNDRDFRRAFMTSKLSFSHDTGRVTIRVKDINDMKDSQDRQMPAADLLRDISHRAVLRMIRSDCPIMWHRSLDAVGDDMVSPRFVPVPDDVWSYSFGKFLEDLFYGKSMQIDGKRYPHLRRVRGSRDPMLVHYFSRNGRVVSVQCEPVEPVLHVALQPALWQDRIDHNQQLADIMELCDLAQEVYLVTTTKVTESLDDPVTPPHAKHNLKILRNEVQQWYSCYASKVESDPPADIFAKNTEFRDIFKRAAGWSSRITQAIHSTVKLTLKHPESSPKSALPKAWFQQLAGAMEREGGTATGAVDYPPMQFQETVTENAGDLENLAKFARSLASGEVSAPSRFSNVSNEVANTLNAKSKRTLDMFDSVSVDEREEVSSRSLQAPDSVDSTTYINNVGTASTIGSMASRLALDAFRRSMQAKVQSDGLGYLTIPKRILAWHPSLPRGVQGTVVLVNATQPTSVVAYSLCSTEYTRQLNKSLREERVLLDGQVNAVQMEAKGIGSDANLLSILRSTKRNNIDHVFVDENQFQSATRFSCKSYYAMQFHALRRLYYGGDRNYVESLCHCEQWVTAGGKSGAAFLKTQDQRFIAKAIPQIELQMFLSMANEYFGYMAKTFENNLSSMLSKVLGIYKVTISSDTDQTMCVLVMENLIYGREVNYLFDLKGKMEGRYKERSDADKNATGVVLWDRNFVEMAGGIPLPLQESAMSLLLSAIVNDTSFLSSVQATDYSMLVGYDVRKQEVVACIIDYIHKYDFLKMVEHAGKRLIQEEGEITVLNPKHYRKRFCMAMTKYFTTIPSRYTKVTTVARNANVGGVSSGNGMNPTEREEVAEGSPPATIALQVVNSRSI